MIVAATHLFTEQGYAATTIRSVAARAEISPETVYAAFGTKRRLLSAVLDVAIVGDDEPLPLMERRWVQELRNEPDPRKRLHILARNGSHILRRISPIYEVLRGAAVVDPELSSLWAGYSAQRFAGQRELVTVVGAGGVLREGLTVGEAADILFVVGSPETYRLLTVDRGWSPNHFTRWYEETLMRLLLA